MTVDQCLAHHGYNVVTNPYHSLEKIKKKANRKMFSQTNYLEEDSAINHLTFGKTNRVCKYTFSVQKLCHL